MQSATTMKSSGLSSTGARFWDWRCWRCRSWLLCRGSRTRWEPDSLLERKFSYQIICLLDFRQPRGHHNVQKPEAKVRRSRRWASPPCSPQWHGKYSDLPHCRLLLCPHRAVDIPRSQPHQNRCYRQNRSHLRLCHLPNAAGSCYRLVRMLRHHRLHGVAGSVLLQINFISSNQ